MFAIVAENMGADKAQLRIAPRRSHVRVQYDKVEKNCSACVKNELRCASSTRRASYACRKTMMVRQSSVAEWEKVAAWMWKNYGNTTTAAQTSQLICGLGQTGDRPFRPISDQEYSLGNVELAGCGAQEPLIVAATKRVDA